MPDAPQFAPQRFQTTRWSVILQLRGADSEGAESAWNELAKNYWFPLYAFCRRQGFSEEDARDLTQGFFVHLLSGDRFESVAPEKGRFRTFLLVSFKNFLSNQHRNGATQIRGGGKTVLSIDALQADSMFQQAQLKEESPDHAFERAWAEALLARVKDRLAQDYARANKSDLFAVIQSHLVPETATTSRQEISQKLGLSQAAVNMSIMRMRRRYREILLDEVSSTVDDPSEIEDEIRSLMRAFQKSPT